MHQTILFMIIGFMIFVPGHSYADKQKPERIGEKYDVEKALKEVILKTEKVLLGKSTWEISAELGFSTKEENVLSFRDDGDSLSIDLEEQVQYVFISNLRIDYGVTDDLETHVSFPLLYKEIETTFQSNTRDDSEKGLGDINAGIKYQVKRETGNLPDIMIGLSVFFPSGKDPYEASLRDVPLGNGHWEISVGMSVVKSSDPAVLFGGIGYSYSFERDIQGNKIEPGYYINYNFGVAFALNNQISLKFQTIGAYTSALEVNNTSLGRSSVPILFETGLTYIFSKSMYVNMGVGVGITSDAPDGIIGLSISKRF